MDLARRATAAAMTIVAVTATCVGIGSPVGAAPKAPKAETPEQVQARTGYHSRDLCADRVPGRASCLARVIDRGPSDPTPLAATAPYGATPAQIKAAYGFPTSTTAGAGQTIAVIGAYDSPTVQNDLNVFSNTFGLPCNACLTKVNQTGGTTYPAYEAGWAAETNLDVQWAHAIAPGAKILLVEATTNNWSDLMAAVDYAKARAQYVTMSFGALEFATQTQFDSRFVAPGVTFFAAAGDSGLQPHYPSTSPNVVSVGGTTLNNLGTSNVTEIAWSSGGGGCSAYAVANPAQSAFSQYGQSGCLQQGTTTRSGRKGATTTTASVARRATPDVSLNGNPMSGVSVYNSLPAGSAGWTKVGGTSASAPMFAGRAAVAGGLMDAARIYGANAPNLRDITSGNNGAPALVGFDLASGRGSWFDGTTTTTTTTTPPPSGAGIVNGGFETGSLTGWTPAGAVAAATGNQVAGGYSGQVGSPAGTSGDSSATQTFTVPTFSTTLQFWYKPVCGDPVTEGWATATLRDNATGAVTTVLPPTCATSGYTKVTSPVTAGRSYTVTLTNHDDNVAGEATYTQFDSVLTF